MAYPVIRINNVTGSDTQASGAGPDPAIYGTQAVTSSDGKTVDLSLDNPDLSGVATDGSHVIWLGGTGDIEFSQIVGVDNVAKTVTVNDAFPASLTNLSWAIGGKRASIQNTVAQSLWSTNQDRMPRVFDVEYTGSDYTADDVRVAYHAIVRGVGGRPRIKDTGAATSYIFSGGFRQGTAVFQNLELVSSTWLANGTRSLRGLDADPWWPYIAVDVVAKGFNVGFWCTSYSEHTKTWCVGCVAQSCNQGFHIGGHGAILLYSCTADGCTYGVDTAGNPECFLVGLILRGCQHGIRFGVGSDNSPTTIHFSDSVIEGCTSDAIHVYGNTGSENADLIINNVILYSNGGYGIYFTKNPMYSSLIRVWRGPVAYGALTSGITNDADAYPSLPNDITLTEDPFVDRLNGNYALNDAPGGGKLLKDAGWPQTWPGLPNTTSYPDIGAVESQAGAGSSSGPPIPIPVPTRRGWI